MLNWNSECEYINRWIRLFLWSSAVKSSEVLVVQTRRSRCFNLCPNKVVVVVEGIADTIHLMLSNCDCSTRLNNLSHSLETIHNNFVISMALLSASYSSPSTTRVAEAVTWMIG